MRYLCQLASSVPPDSSDVTMKTTNMKTTNMCVCVFVGVLCGPEALANMTTMQTGLEQARP